MDVFLESGYREQYNMHYDESLALFQCPYIDQYLHTSFGKTYVLQFGNSNNPPLVLLHGMTMSSVMWYPNVKAWSEYYCVYAIDIIGDIGKSEANEIIMQKEEAVAWLKETVDALGLDQFYLAGHSIGGYIALRFTMAYEERVKKLALFAPAAAFHRLHWRFFYYSFPGLLFQTEKWVDRAFRGLSAEGLPFAPGYREFMLAGYHHALPRLRLYPLKIEPEELATIKLPILLMIGEHEVLYPAHKAMEYAQTNVPNITCILVHDANHTLTIEQPQIINEQVLSYLHSEISRNSERSGAEDESSDK